MMIANNREGTVVGTKSPYPTVDMDTKASHNPPPNESIVGSRRKNPKPESNQATKANPIAKGIPLAKNHRPVESNPLTVKNNIDIILRIRAAASQTPCINPDKLKAATTIIKRFNQLLER